jgi:glycerophosphoryl diester phosphodiesterase
VWAIAHRGASGHAPENTIAAYRRAAELGAHFIEADLQLTRDARLVAIHDETVDRTTNGRGPVHSLTLEEVCALDAGSWFKSSDGRSYAGERVPALPEVLKFASESDVTFYLELKGGSTWGAEHALVSALRDSGEATRAVVLSFHTGQLEAIRRLDDTLMTGYLYDTPLSDPIARAMRAGARQLAPQHTLITPQLMEDAAKVGLQVITWSVDDEPRMRELQQMGVSGIMSDYPERVVHAIATPAPSPESK